MSAQPQTEPEQAPEPDPVEKDASAGGVENVDPAAEQGRYAEGKGNEDAEPVITGRRRGASAAGNDLTEAARAEAHRLANRRAPRGGQANPSISVTDPEWKDEIDVLHAKDLPKGPVKGKDAAPAKGGDPAAAEASPDAGPAAEAPAEPVAEPEAEPEAQAPADPSETP